uniref:Uncharacterized protein n=1 Tax=Ochrobactrum phage ORM_20 TaxID=2985243 RepID=A0A9N6ZGI4_9VIRU|nr:hypothetical protein ORM20_00182 [Ochrobactrum phage ORM_20]
MHIDDIKTNDLTQDEILANRRRWIEYMRKPHRRKYRGALVNERRRDERCCLGHACAAFGLRTTEVASGEIGYVDQDTQLPKQMMKALGLHTMFGSSLSSRFDDRILKHMKMTGNEKYDKVSGWRPSALTHLNDETSTSPKAIADYLEEVILGGEATPFVSITNYPK